MTGQIYNIQRLFSRLFTTNVQSELKAQQPCDPLKFVTGCSGFGNSLAPGSTGCGPKKWTFGDDSYFIARNKAADVLGNMRFTLFLLTL